MVSHCSLSDSKSPQLSRTHLSILADLNNAVVWMVSTCPRIFKFYSPCTNPLVTVPIAPITIGITVTFCFALFFNFLARSRYLFPFSLSFNFTVWLAATAKSTIRKFSFLLTANLVIWPRLGDCLYIKIPEEFVRLILYYYHLLLRISVSYWSLSDSKST